MTSSRGSYETHDQSASSSSSSSPNVISSEDSVFWRSRQSNNAAIFRRNDCEQHDDSVCVPRVNHDSLVQIAEQYYNLCQNLICGGVDDQTLQLLSRHVSAPSSTAGFDGNAIPGRLGPRTHPGSILDGTDNHYHPRVQHDGRYTGNFDNQQSSTDWVDDESLQDGVSTCPGTHPSDVPDVAPGITRHEQPRVLFQRNARRSVQLLSLPDGITHSDITSAIRGGLLLDVYLRTRDKVAAISFLHADDAEAFYNHVRRHDLYIKNKRVDVKWNDRQYVLPGHIAKKIASGASRNIVIRRHDRNNTIECVRDDLEHIHNLIIVKIEVIGDSCFISTNSVSNAMFARTCMISRQKYKGSRIEFDIDECAQPLERMSVHRRPSTATVPPKRAMNPKANRFDLLSVDC